MLHVYQAIKRLKIIIDVVKSFVWKVRRPEASTAGSDARKKHRPI